MNSFMYRIIVFLVLVICACLPAYAVKPEIITGASPLDRERNLVLNGSFEEPRNTDGDMTTWPPTIDGEGYYFLGPNNTLYGPIGFPDNWTVTGGGTDTYAIWGNRYAFSASSAKISGIVWSDPNFHGDRELYLGNSFVSEITEVPTFMPDGEVIFDNPPDITPGPGYGPDPLTVTQTLTGLVPSKEYRLSFWVSAEWTDPDAFTFPFTSTVDDSIMALLLEGFDILYLTVPAGPLNADLHVFGTDPSHVYTVEFEAQESEMDISFINWGHYTPGFTQGWTGELTTELVIDDVILNSFDFVLNPIFPALDDNINFVSTENATPNENVALLWGKLPGLFSVPGRVCNGIEIGIDKPRILAVERANEFGVATYIFYIPLFNDLQFATQLQAVDIETCRVSNQIEQIIRKDDEGQQ